MDDNKWEKWSALAGILFVALTLVSFFIPGSPPKTSDSAAKVAKFVTEHRSDIRWAGYIGALGSLVALWWLGAVWRMMRRAEGGSPRLTLVATAGGIFASVLGAMSGVMLGVLGILGVAGSGGAGGTRFFYVLATNLGILTAIGIAAFVGAVSAVIIRTAFFPRLLGWFGALVALASVVGAAAVASTRDAFFVLSMIAFLGFAVFAVILSVLMHRAVPSEATADAPAARMAASTA